MFKNPFTLPQTISQRIMLSFLSLLLIIFFITAFNVIGMNNAQKRFAQSNVVSHDSNAIQKIDRQVSELERAILVFSQGKKSSNSSQLQGIYSQLLADINLLMADNAFEVTAHKTTLKQMHTAVTKFREKIDSLVTQKEDRDALVNTKLIGLYEEINASMISLFMETSKGSNKAISEQLQKAQLNISQAEVLSGRYFAYHELLFRQQVFSQIKAAHNILKTLQAADEGMPLAAQTGHIAQLLAQTKKTFTQALQAERSYTLLVNVVIAGEFAELKYAAEHLKNVSLQHQAQLFSFTEERIGLIQRYALYAAVIGSTLAIGIAFLTGKFIRKPLEEITDTFERLALGENLHEIPGATRKDEIGRLAQAADVFRGTNEEIKKRVAELDIANAELAMARDEASIANKAKSEFLASMSHDLRTPLNAIMGFSDIMKEKTFGPLGDPHYEEYVADIHDSGSLLVSLINDVLDLSKVEAGKYDLVEEPLDISTLFNISFKQLSHMAKTSNQTLSFDVPPAMPSLLGDERVLIQILNNLLSNAIKFTPNEGAINVVAKVDGNNSIVLTVTDTGMGMSKEDIVRAQNPFEQADGMHSKIHEGTGLGLHLCINFMELFGGTLKIESVIDKGTTITLRFPPERTIRPS